VPDESGIVRRHCFIAWTVLQRNFEYKKYNFSHAEIPSLRISSATIIKPMLLIASKDTLTKPSTCCNVQALNRYRRNEAIQSRRSIGTNQKLLRPMSERTLSRIKLPYQTIVICSMICSRFTQSTTPVAVEPNMQATRQRIKRSRDNSVTRPIEARSSKSVFQVKPKEERSWIRK
jgi:hypothetical protein